MNHLSQSLPQPMISSLNFPLPVQLWSGMRERAALVGAWHLARISPLNLFKRKGKTGMSRCNLFSKLLGVFYLGGRVWLFRFPSYSSHNTQKCTLNYHFGLLTSLVYRLQSMYFLVGTVTQTVWPWWSKDYFNPDIVNAFLGLFVVAVIYLSWGWRNLIKK